MKKNGKKWRKIQKEKEIRRANIKVGEPYSKARHKIRLCRHYETISSGFSRGFCISHLLPISDTECRCYECNKIFPIEKYEQMEALDLINIRCVTNRKLFASLLDGLEPVYYRRLSETETEILETIKDKRL